MSIFQLDQEQSFGSVQSVDTTSVTVIATDIELLTRMQVNQLVAIRSSRIGQTLIGMISKITRKIGDGGDEEVLEENPSFDMVKVTLIGTLMDRVGLRRNVFTRSIESVPSIDAECYLLRNEMLSAFMGVIAQGEAETTNPLCLGTYVLSEGAKACVDGNKLFQRHAVITGSTGSGKSYAVALISEQLAKLPSANAVLFDIHGEYSSLVNTNIHHYRIAGPTDSSGEGVLFLPYWLLNYDEMLSLVLDRSDSNAPNQAMLFQRTMLEKKRDELRSIGHNNLAETITVDSPTPFQLTAVVKKLSELDVQMVEGSGKKLKQGDFYGKLSRFIQRLENKLRDRRLNFMFSPDPLLLKLDYIDELCQKLLLPASRGGGVKIIDFSEVPSDILPLIVSLVARLIFTVQQWTDRDKIHPVALFCDEAHLYLPQTVQRAWEQTSVDTFERLAKEGRKYGVGLVVVTQRPSEVSRTILSQSGNFIAMRLSNAEDQAIIKRLLPDSLGDFADILPVLNVAEALVVGDACLLPSRIRVGEPENKPKSDTVQFWTQWSKSTVEDTIRSAVDAMRKQKKD